jgi:surface polysaccharide O-acyltransferase-like enzyme
VDVATGKPYYHLYFLFVLAGLYAITPFLRVVVAHARPRMVGTFAAVLLAIGVLDQALSVLLRTGQSNAVTQFLPFAGYFVAGWRLQQLPLTRRLVRGAALAFVLGAGLTTVGTWLLMDHTKWDWADEYFVMPLSPTVMMTALGAFVLFRALAARVPDAGDGTRGRVVRRLSDLSFGVYLVHPAVLTQIRDRVGYPQTVTGVLTTAASILVVTLAASIAITAVGRRIPGLRAIF